MLGKMTLVKTIIISGSMVERSSSLLLDLRYVGSIHVADENGRAVELLSHCFAKICGKTEITEIFT